MSLPVPDTVLTIKRILIVRTDRLGDVVLTLPMLPELRKRYPDAHIAMLLRTYTGEIVIDNPYLDELIWYDADDQLVPFGTMVASLRERKFDAVIVVYPTIRLAWLVFRARIPVRIGTGYRYYSMLFNRRVYEHRKDAKKHEVEYNLRLLQELGCQVNGAPEFHIHISDLQEKEIRGIAETAGIDLGRSYAIIHPGSGGSARDWSTKRFGELADRLHRESKLQVIVTGTESENVKVSEVVRAAHRNAVPLVGKMNLRQFAALIRDAALFVSNSTGPIHVAAAMGTPVIGLYPQHTPMSERRWGPCTSKKRVFVPDRPLECTDCIEQSLPQCNCMDTIEVEDVFMAATQLMNRSILERKGESS